MNEFLISGSLAALLIVVCSFIIYEILCFIWSRLPEITWPPRIRVLCVVAGTFIGHIINIWLFGVIYYVMIIFDLGKFTGASIERGDYSIDLFGCAYISSVLYTTLGAGDVTPEGSLRMIVGVEGLIGFILIGWTISFTYLAMEKFWQLPHRRNK